MRRGSGVDLHLAVVRAVGSKGRSLEAALREAVRTGRLAAGTRLPGTRALAADLGLARGTVVQVYSQLVAEGWLVGVPGSSTQVADVPAEPSAGHLERDTELPDRPARLGPPSRAGSADDARPVIDLRPGRPDLSAFPRTLWAAAVRRVLATAANELLDYPPPAGLPAARAAVADYVSRTRGVRADAASVVITAGFSDGLALLARALRTLGVERVATENPGLSRHRELIAAAGLGTEPVSVGVAGAEPGELSEWAGAALLTPAHQHPRGVVLDPRRRAAFVAWARRRDGYLVEDDYDGEFRYDQQPVGAMQALAPDRVVFAGTTSKALAPGIRLGWLVVPPALRAAVLAARGETGEGVPALDQLVLTELLALGDYDRQVRRVRLAYRRRRNELAERLASVTPVPLDGVPAGLHALFPVESAAQERRVVARAAHAGLQLHGLHTYGYWHTEDDAQPAALVLGYATPPRHDWRRCLAALAALISAEDERSYPADPADPPNSARQDR